jgi:hypothetical protein
MSLGCRGMMPLLSFIKNAQNQTDVEDVADAAFPDQEQ